MRIDEVLTPLSEGEHDPHIFKAVFLAGSPGAGKTTIANRLFKGTGLKHLNVDDFYNFLRTHKPETLTKDIGVNYDLAWNKYRSREQNYLQGRLGLIIDGTAKNPEKMKIVKEELEALGYETAMVFVNTSLETSVKRAAKRSQMQGPDYGRTIDPKLVRDTWERVQSGLGKLQSIFGKRFYIIDNNHAEPNIDYVRDSVTKWINSPPETHIAKEWIKKEKEAKTQGELPASQQPKHKKKSDAELN